VEVMLVNQKVAPMVIMVTMECLIREVGEAERLLETVALTEVTEVRE
jgi:hypothetical protein